MQNQKISPDDLKKIRWGSHVPTNTSILKTFPIKGVLELGAGFNSTPLFFENCEYVISIENDLNWINTLRENDLIKETEKHKLVYQELPSTINRSTHRNDISKDILADAVKFYKSFSSDNINFLFVDCYAGFRLDALINLHEEYDVITYHDTEQKFEHCYDYRKFKPSEQYIQMFDKTFPAEVGILISKKYEYLLPLFLKNHAEQTKLYCDRFNCYYKPTIEIK